MLKLCSSAHRDLAELKGASKSIPNQGILISTLALKEAKRGAGFRKLPGTDLRNRTGQIIYTPPQHPDETHTLMTQLEHFINAPSPDRDPLVKMALLHHQFESIHPFHDGNGRAGRILNVLFLVVTGLFDISVLYLSRYLIQTKQEYYRLLQQVRDTGAWKHRLID